MFHNVKGEHQEFTHYSCSKKKITIYNSSGSYFEHATSFEFSYCLSVAFNKEITQTIKTAVHKKRHKIIYIFIYNIKQIKFIIIYMERGKQRISVSSQGLVISYVLSHKFTHISKARKHGGLFCPALQEIC